MNHKYTPNPLGRLLATVILLLFAIAANAQQVNPFNEVLTMAGLTRDNLKKDFPQLTKVLAKESYTLEDINKWIGNQPKEWNEFNQLAPVKKLNIAWSTLGVKTPEKAAEFHHPMYDWYKASKISEQKRNQLFPHFPLPDLKKDVNAELSNYEQRISAWQRLYTEEYQTFLNTPELTALNPYYNGYYKLPYIPKFIGVTIGLEKPVKQNTGNEIKDDYNYQLALRNWYFVFKPAEFERLYGKDFKFPEDFDAKTYREHTIKVLEDTKKGVYPNMQNEH